MTAPSPVDSRPLKFRPLIKQIRWGGRRLGDVLNKPIGEASDYAESWELVDHGEDQSVVVEPSDSALCGCTLSEIVTQHGSDLFGSATTRSQFPLLIKFLDASDRLSVQVHPDDTLAKTFDPTENGKTEAWVILDAAPNAKLYAGLKEGVTKSDLRTALDNETVESLLHTIDVCAGDCVFIPAGTVHAIGEGVLLAEVQQASDMTFRLYDWGRVGTDGQPRKLHIDESFRAIDWNRGPVERVTPKPLDHATESLVECPFFTIKRVTCHESYALAAEDRARVLIGIEGDASVLHDRQAMSVARGQTVLVPSGISCEVSGRGVILDVACP